jgi:hypothetical protein
MTQLLSTQDLRKRKYITYRQDINYIKNILKEFGKIEVDEIGENIKKKIQNKIELNESIIKFIHYFAHNILSECNIINYLFLKYKEKARANKINDCLDFFKVNLNMFLWEFNERILQFENLILQMNSYKIPTEDVIRLFNILGSHKIYKIYYFNKDKFSSFNEFMEIISMFCIQQNLYFNFNDFSKQKE